MINEKKFLNLSLDDNSETANIEVEKCYVCGKYYKKSDLYKSVCATCDRA